MFDIISDNLQTDVQEKLADYDFVILNYALDTLATMVFQKTEGVNFQKTSAASSC